MSNFKNFQFYNFKGGLDYKNSPPLVSQSETKSSWADGYNVELLEDGGIVKMNGSQLFASLPEGSNDTIIGGFEGEQNGNKFIVVVTNNGNFYQYKNGEFILKKSGLTTGAKPIFKTYLNGVFVSNGIDEPFIFVPNDSPEIHSCNCTTAGGHDIRGIAVEIYKGRIWIADGSTVYYSALGKYDDWSTADDSGSISNFHNDTSKITALCCFKDMLVIHKEESSFFLSGYSPENFTIQPFSNLGAISPFGINTANGRHLFFNKQVYPFQVNELGEIVQGNPVSLMIESKLSEFVNSKNDKCMFLNYKNKSQLWCFLYKSNENYFTDILIYDYMNNAWFLRIVPYEIVTAWECDDIIYSALSDGKIVKEGVGTTFLNQPVKFMWASPFFHFGRVNSYKTIEDVALILATDKDNNFTFQTRKDYSNYEIFDKVTFSNVTTNMLVYCDENGNLGQGVLDGDEISYGFATMPAQKVENFITAVTGSNKSVQIQIYGNENYNSLSLLGLEFRGTYFDV
ncbi:MAG: hypothetical protein MJ180_00565 [Candidatus Gastranaerophilales bacterium]|nr:hypothetical protein [Candidatus Gastranaerophilales bacterium]